MIKYILFVSIIFFLVSIGVADSQATKLVQTACKNLQGRVYSCHKVKLTIVRPWQKTVREMIVHYGGKKYTLIQIVKPIRDRNTVILKRFNDLWIYSPKVRKIIRVPFENMKESIFFSDFDYNDVVKSATIGDDYIHKIIGVSKIFSCYGKVYIIDMFPKPGIKGTYKKLRVWIREKDALFLYIQYYNDNFKINRVLEYSQFKKINNRSIATQWKMHNLSKKHYYTIYQIEKSFYTNMLSDHIFQLRCLKNPPNEPFNFK